jgi:hypothetical protein
MPTVLWNPPGFPAMTMLHSRASFDARGFINQNLLPFVEKLCLMRGMLEKEN